MRIPTSVIVMSLVTAVPFGLGIRDTLKHKDVTADEFGDGLSTDFGGGRKARERSAELEQYEAELKAEQLEREAQSAKRVAQLDQLFGVKPAQMGALLDGIVLGTGAGSFQPEDVRRRIENASRDGYISVMFDADATSLNGVDVTVNGDSDDCEKLGEKLADGWGRATNGAWLDPATHQRATFDQDSCKLHFDRYLEPTDWVARLPLDKVGASADKVAEQVGSADFDDERGYWNQPGLRFGIGDTKLEAYVAKGKLIGFKATVKSDFDSMLAVRDALSAKLKAQPKKQAEATDDYGDYSDANVWEWKRRVPVTLEQIDTDRFSVLVGKMPWD